MRTKPNPHQAQRHLPQPDPVKASFFPKLPPVLSARLAPDQATQPPHWRQRYRALLRDRKQHLTPKSIRATAAIAPSNRQLFHFRRPRPQQSGTPRPFLWLWLSQRLGRPQWWGIAALLLSATALAQGALSPAPTAQTPPPKPQIEQPTVGDRLHQVATTLFATPNSVGAIALGVAEGTRTVDGGKTLLWHQHTDPGNGAQNQGTFSWQLGADNAADADRRGLQRIQQVAIPHLMQQAQTAKIALTPELLVQAIDLWNQAPAAGRDFLPHLQRCQAQGDRQAAPTLQTELILCARLAAFHNPKTGELEASGFDWDYARLEADQRRRIRAVQEVMAYYQSSTWDFTAAAAPPPES